MKKSKFTEAQIAFSIKQAETGTRLEEVCRKMGISEATIHNWKKKYDGLGVAELLRLRLWRNKHHELELVLFHSTCILFDYTHRSGSGRGHCRNARHLYVGSLRYQSLWCFRSRNDGHLCGLRGRRRRSTFTIAPTGKSAPVRAKMVQFISTPKTYPTENTGYRSDKGINWKDIKSL